MIEIEELGGKYYKKIIAVRYSDQFGRIAGLQTKNLQSFSLFLVIHRG
jgi:hypothetical protein